MKIAEEPLPPEVRSRVRDEIAGKVRNVADALPALPSVLFAIVRLPINPEALLNVMFDGVDTRSVLDAAEVMVGLNVSADPDWLLKSSVPVPVKVTELAFVICEMPFPLEPSHANVAPVATVIEPENEVPVP
jgi:hypothetical protein